MWTAAAEVHPNNKIQGHKHLYCTWWTKQGVIGKCPQPGQICTLLLAPALHLLKSMFSVGIFFNYGYRHKVLTYIEYRAVSGVFRTIDSPRTKGGGGGWYILAGRWGGGGVNFDARHWIGLLQYNPSTGTDVHGLSIQCLSSVLEFFYNLWGLGIE